MSKYQQLAQDLKNRITQGVWQAGDKLPSLRKTVSDSGLSLMTVLNVYQLLESQGVILAQAKSGYIVAPQPEVFRYPETQRQIYFSDKVDINEFVFSVLQASKQAGIVPFGSAFPDPSLFPQQALARSLVKVTRQMSPSFAADNLPQAMLDYARRFPNVMPS
ncbi:GntR family transcriptional regulator [Shewanella seohaensis]|nr:GntR family transcriptional regulator [Shewanella seohaensis]